MADWMLHHVTTFLAGTFSWQDPVHSWKAGPGEVMTVEKQTNKDAAMAPAPSAANSASQFLFIQPISISKPLLVDSL